MNRYMMNPIFRSKQTLTSLQMHRYSGVPWRGGSNIGVLGGQLNINPINQATPQTHEINPNDLEVQQRI